MKIALVTHCYFPRHVHGTEVYVMNLARELKALGHEPVVLSASFQDEEPQAEPIERYEWDGVPVVSIDKHIAPHTTIAETYDQPAMRAVHARILDEIRPDVLHVCHLANHTAVLLDVAAEKGLPAFTTLTDFFAFCLTNKLEAADGSLCAGPNATRSNCIACHLKGAAQHGGRASRLAGSPWMRPIAARALAWIARIAPETRIASLRPADIVDRPDRLRAKLAAYREAVAPTAVLGDAHRANGFPAPLDFHHFGINIDRTPKPPPPDPGKVRLAYYGQIAEHKGVGLLMEALAKISRPNLELTIWGDTDRDPDFIAKLRHLAAGLPVHFPGRFERDRVAEVLAEADIAVIPSTWYENSPQSLMEALATHTPVIVSDVAGLTEFVQPGISGFVFPRGDVDGLADILRRLSDEPGLAHAMSQTTHYDRTLRDQALSILAMYARHGVTG